ncbi:hypothetical protein CMEL01_08982 [Colletotrichum melonis]|uniref:BTB domain-containing protein n=1 Tax=Colletotrichum melonis TaxID=1209925 RepID=A0AAI9TYQ0_9PEZI|nr:hypothetical protein CMEL01_08982 [Colletotrichum melonis]
MAKKKANYEITKSRIIKFIVGWDKVEHNVHEAVIGRLSKPLRALVTNGMRESVEGVVVWADVDSDIFAILMEFAYTKKLTITDENEERVRQFEKAESLQHRIIYYAWHSETGESIPGDLDPAWHRLIHDWHYDNLEITHIHSREYFMSHARVYILGDQYIIHSLMDACIKKLRRVIVRHPFTDEFAQIICDLIVFIWPKTLPNDQFREVLIDYLRIEFDRAFKFPCIIKVSEEVPEIYTEVLNRSPKVQEDLVECDRFMAMHLEPRNRKPLYQKPSSSLRDSASAQPEREQRKRLLRF